MHGDSGNTGSTDIGGPLGVRVKSGSAAQLMGVMLWASDGTLFGGAIDTSNPQTAQLGMAIYDPGTLEVLASWFPDSFQNLNLGYAQLLKDEKITVVSSSEGHIFVLQGVQCGSRLGLDLVRHLDVSSDLGLDGGQGLLNSMFDSTGNIWWTTGAILGMGNPPQSSFTVGYIEPNGTSHTLRVSGQMVENGIAINGSVVYVVTGPGIGSPFGQGFVWAFTTGPGYTITELWKAAYDAGSGVKPGGFARGSGSTPALLGEQYVAVTDNADGRIHLLILHQDPQPSEAGQVYCSVPLFAHGASANDIRPTVHFDGETYGVVIQNGHGSPPLFLAPSPETPINGAFNNMTGMAGGIARVDVTDNGCSVHWEVPAAMKSVPVLSTKTGVLYGYIQDSDKARDGHYVWHVAAMDWRTGHVEWKYQAGAGGTFNDNFMPGSIGPDGRFYQGVVGGMLWVRDG